jgi:membrane protease YdiL (CAAX protease family)
MEGVLCGLEPDAAKPMQNQDSEPASREHQDPITEPSTETQDHIPSGDAVPSALPADIHSPLRGVDLLFMALFYFVGGILLFLAVGVGGVRLLGFSHSALQDSIAIRSAVIIVSQGLLLGAMLLFLYLLVRSRGEQRFWRAVGWRPFRERIGWSLIFRYLFGGLLLAVAAGAASQLFNQDIDLPMEELLRDRQSVLLLMALGVLLAPLVEETVYRGCVYPVLARKLGMGLGVFTTGMLFGLAHAPQLWPGYGQIGLIVAVGTVLTYIRARSGTVAASYIVHLGYNMVLFAGYYFATGGFNQFRS